MILECPNCEIRYEVPVDLPPEGRKVRCASCQHVWNATHENQPKPAISLADFEDPEIVFKNNEEPVDEPASEPAAKSEVEPAAKPDVEPEADTGNSQGSIDDIFAQDIEPEEPPQEPEADSGNSQNSIDDIFAQDPEAEEAPQEPAPESSSETTPAAPADTDAEADNDEFAKSVSAPADKAEASDTTDDSFSESAMEEVFSSAMQDADISGAKFAGEEPEEAESPPIVIGKAKRRRRFVPSGIAAGWAALAILLSGVTSFSYFERIAVVRALPGAAATYERLGLPVNVRGLEFDKIKYSWESSAGRPILEVYGDIINVTSEPIKVPTVVFGLRTKEKVEVYQWAADVRSELLPGGQRTAFSAQIPTPPKSIRDVQVRFAKVR